MRRNTPHSSVRSSVDEQSKFHAPIIGRRGRALGTVRRPFGEYGERWRWGRGRRGEACGVSSLGCLENPFDVVSQDFLERRELFWRPQSKGRSHRESENSSTQALSGSCADGRMDRRGDGETCGCEVDGWLA